MKSLLILIFLITTAHAIIGYDCTVNLINKTSFSLTQTKPCTIRQHKISKEIVEIQLIQPRVIKKIKTFHCLVELRHIVSRCGKSWFQTYDGGFYSDIPKIERDECYDMIKSRRYQIQGIQRIIHLTGEKTKWTGETWGTNDDGGNCQPGPPFSVGAHHFDRPIRTSDIMITTYTESANLDIGTNKIIFGDGTRCDYTNMECFTNQKGYAFWDSFVHIESCFSQPDNFQVLYQGQATKITEYFKNKIPYISYLFTTHGHDISIASKMAHEQCGIEVIQTEHPKLTIIENVSGMRGNFPIKVTNLEPEDTNIMLYFNQKLVYMMRHIKMQVDQLYEQIQLDRCRVEQLALRNELAIAFMSPELFAYNYFKEPGYMAVRRGEVVHVAKCARVSVNFRDDPICYDELPITYNNKSMFLTPVSRIIVKRGTVITCNGVAGTMYNVDGEWYTVNEHMVRTKHPVVLGPNDDEDDWEFESVPDLVQRGIYSERNLDEVQHMFITPMENKVVQNVISSRILEKVDDAAEINFADALREGDYNIIRSNITNWFLGMFKIFSIYREYILDLIVIMFSLYVICAIISKVFTCISARKMKLGWVSTIGICCIQPIQLLLHRKTQQNLAQMEEMSVLKMNELEAKMERISEQNETLKKDQQQWKIPSKHEISALHGRIAH